MKASVRYAIQAKKIQSYGAIGIILFALVGGVLTGNVGLVIMCAVLIPIPFIGFLLFRSVMESTDRHDEDS